MAELPDRRQRWIDWANERYPGRDDIAGAAADAALRVLDTGGTDDDAAAAARREIRKQFPEEGSRLAITDPSHAVIATQPISISAREAFKLGIFAGAGFLLLLAVVWAIVTLATLVLSPSLRP
jgi:hypothetical protein